MVAGDISTGKLAQRHLTTKRGLPTWHRYRQLLTRIPRGCVSGQQLETLRDLIGKDDGDYDFDALDGYDEMK